MSGVESDLMSAGQHQGHRVLPHVVHGCDADIIMLTMTRDIMEHGQGLVTVAMTPGSGLGLSPLNTSWR